MQSGLKGSIIYCNTEEARITKGGQFQSKLTCPSIRRRKMLTICRVRLLREEPHTQKAAESAIGLRTDNGRRKEEELKDSVHEPTAMEIETT